MMQKIILKACMLLLLLSACKEEPKEKPELQATQEENVETTQDVKPFFKLSLAQWSLNRAIRSGEMNVMDFAKKAKELGFEGIEYVSQLYTKELEKDADAKVAMQNLLQALKSESEKHGVKNLIIMIDNEGELASTKEAERKKAVENHKKWVDAAQELGCHSIRVNLFGAETEKEWVAAAADGLGKLADYAKTKNVNVIVENHGGFSSNAVLLVEAIEKADRANCGTLPDFGNFCLEREGGARWEAKCIKEYPKYQGVEELMPHAKAVSAKSYDFDAEGNETTIDYKKMLEIVKDAGYSGFIGVEYEGERLGEIEGIKATRELLLNAAGQLD